MICIVRPLDPNDVPYVLECWVQTERQHVRGSREHAMAHAKSLLAEHGAKVAVLPEDSDAILGFACVESSGRTRMAYVRRSARGLGICKQLFTEKEKTR